MKTLVETTCALGVANSSPLTLCTQHILLLLLLLQSTGKHDT
jgi:hypothetical protein